jgi:phosphate transport system permease protein
MSAGGAAVAGGPHARTAAVESASTWRLVDRLGLAACWACGLLLCAVAAAIVIYMLVRGIQYVRPAELFAHPLPSLDQSKTGGYLDPLIGTVLLTVMGTVIAAPLGVAVAVWLVEYGRPFWLARAVESGLEIVAGTPSIVLAIFGLLIFQQHLFAALSFTAAGNAVYGRSFFAASAMMALIALPLVFGASREALRAVPGHVREASYALGKTKIATIRRVLLPAIRPGIATGTALGMGRIAGDTAIVVILLGASQTLQPVGDVPGLGLLRGTGSTLTSYVYNASPAGEGNSPEKAYAAAFVLLIIVLVLNFGVDLIGRGIRRGPQWNG